MRQNFLPQIFDNPLISKEVKSRMRGRQGFILLTAYLALLSLAIAGIYGYAISEHNLGQYNVGELSDLGKQIFQVVVLLEFLLIALIAPALTSGSISSERERGTFDLLRTTLLSSGALVFGKLGAAIAYLLLLILAALPLQSMAFFLGGVGLAELIISLAMMTTSTLLFGALGMYFSGLSKRTITATTSSYASLILPIIATGGFFYLLVEGNIDTSSMSIEEENLLMFFFWTMLSTNPFTAAFLSQMILEEEQILYLYSQSSLPFPLFSPWILYTVFSLTLTILMIWLIIFYMNRYER
jgi:ABC-type transport system involved in multi-copper enzyme maturation permease subunit